MASLTSSTPGNRLYRSINTPKLPSKPARAHASRWFQIATSRAEHPNHQPRLISSRSLLHGIR
eukprot:1633960-Amphidinium_carterae.1